MISGYAFGSDELSLLYSRFLTDGVLPRLPSLEEYVCDFISEARYECLYLADAYCYLAHLLTDQMWTYAMRTTIVLSEMPSGTSG